jgi:hypothetical protein
MIVDTFRHFVAVSEKKRANRKPCDKMLVSVCCTINAFNLSEFIHRTPLDLHKCLTVFFAVAFFLSLRNSSRVINLPFDKSLQSKNEHLICNQLNNDCGICDAKQFFKLLQIFCGEKLMKCC